MKQLKQNVEYYLAKRIKNAWMISMFSKSKWKFVGAMNN